MSNQSSESTEDGQVVGAGLVRVPPGWYPDTSAPGQQRYWNGSEWTGPSSPLPPHTPGGGAPASANPAALHGLAVASLVVGIAALVLFFVPILDLVLGGFAVIAGLVALSQIRASQKGDAGVKLRRGSGLAIGGIVTGAVALLVGLAIVTIFLLGNNVRNEFKPTSACVAGSAESTC